jgi:hypothetical protein
VRYDAAANAFVLDDAVVYPSPIGARSAAVLARAIAADDRVGVSLGEDAEIVYGRLPRNSEVATDLKLADNFLGDMILPPQEWTVGYRFANGFEPRRNAGNDSTAVFFRFTDFRFAVKDGRLQLTHAGFDARLVPIRQDEAADGGYLPDYKAIAAGTMVEEYRINAEHLGENIDYYLQEEIVARAFSYGQAAAFFRGLKAAGVGLQDLSRSIEASSPAATPAAGRRPASTLDDSWLAYLRDIQARNRFGNWSGPPADLYASRRANGG